VLVCPQTGTPSEMQLGNLAAVHGKTNMLGVAVTAEVVVEFEETILEGIIAGDAPKEAPA
jgi:hypothetical protein